MATAVAPGGDTPSVAPLVAPPVDAPVAPPPVDDPPAVDDPLSLPPPVGPPPSAPGAIGPLDEPDDGALEGVGDDEVDPGLGLSGNVGNGEMGDNVGIGKVNGLVGIGRSEPDDTGPGDGASVGRGVGATVGCGVGATVGFGVGLGVGLGAAAAIVSDTVVVFDAVIPSDSWYVSVAVPENPPPGLYTSAPFDDRSMEPLIPLSSTLLTITVSVSPSASVSLNSTPGAAMLRVVRAGPE